MKTIFWGIAHGTTVRDVLRNDTFLSLKENPDLKHILFVEAAKDEKFVDEFSGHNVEIRPLQPFNTSLAERMIFLFHKAALRHKCESIALGKSSGDKRALNLMTPVAFLARKILGDKGVTRLVGLLYKVFASKTDLYEKEFDEFKPDLVIVTRVLSFSPDYPLLKSAAIKNVRVISLIASWDNLTSKGFFPFSIDSLVVWNNILKEEAEDLFFFPSEKIFVSGIPRYDQFFRLKASKSYRSKEKYFADKGYSLNRKLLIYGTGSGTMGKTKLDQVTQESLLVEFLADSLDKLNEPCQLVVRLHPQAITEEYYNLRNRENVFVEIPGRKSKFKDRLFSSEDEVELAEALAHCDVLLNFGSTISIDAAVFDAPIVCPNFDFLGDRPYQYSMTRLYRFDHMRKLVDFGGIRLPKSKGDMLKEINRYIGDPALESLERKAIVDAMCYNTDGKTGHRVANHILDRLYS